MAKSSVSILTSSGGTLSSAGVATLKFNNVNDYEFTDNLSSVIDGVLKYVPSKKSVRQNPVMTSDTSSGIASASSVFGVGYEAYRAFDNKFADINSVWAAGASTGWLAYEFTSPVVIDSYTIFPRTNAANYNVDSPKNWTFEGWDGSQWIILDTQLNITGWYLGLGKTFYFNNSTAYIKYRINISANNGGSYCVIGELILGKQVPGRYFDTVPKLTSNTSSGTVQTSSVYSTYVGWYVFDNISSGAWIANSSIGWISYTYADGPKVVNDYVIVGADVLARGPQNWTFEGWDGSQWVILDTRSGVTGWQLNERREYSFTNSTAYSSYRLNVSANNGDTYLAIRQLEFISNLDASLNSYITTNNESHIDLQYVSRIQDLTISSYQPSGTDIKFLVSFDGRNTFKTYKDSTWQTVELSAGAASAMPFSELQIALGNYEITTETYLDFVIFFSSDSAEPYIDTLNVSYVSTLNGADVINDAVTGDYTTWSSSMIETKIDRLVANISIDTPITSFSITGLDGNLHGGYEIEYYFKQATGTSAIRTQFYMYYNNDTNNANYNQSWIYDNSSSVGRESYPNSIAQTFAVGEYGSGKGMIFNTPYLNFISQLTGNIQGVLVQLIINSNHIGSISNLNSLTFSCSQTNGIEAGSWIKIYRRK